jgi:Patatin-like phospholipase
VPTPAQPACKLRAILHAAASLRYIAYCLRDLFVCLGVLLIPACLCAVASLILFLPDQTRDYYRLLVEDLADTTINVKCGAATVDAVLPVVFLLGMAACLSFSAVVLLAERSRPSLYRTACARCTITFSPVVFGTLPLLATIAGFSASSRAIDLQTEKASIEGIREFGDEIFVKQLDSLFTWAELSDWYFSLGLWILSAVTIFFFLISTLIVLLNRRATEHQRERFWHITRRVFVASIVFSLAAIVLIAAFPVPIGQTLGSISVFAIFIGCLAMNATGLSLWSRRLDFPIIPAMLALAVFLAWTDLNDDHELRRIDKSGHPVSSSVTSTAGPAGDVEGEFEKWYGARIDKHNDEFNKEQGYPVYIVAAQGGGIYAAAQAVQFLAKLHTTCERFAQHLFAISGVSGGSVGAALYAALTDEFKATKDQCRSIAEIGLGQPRTPQMEHAQEAAFELVRNDYDFLSPLVASALFPDFAQRFFAPPLPALSRARALEQSIEAAWAAIATKFFNGTGGDALRRGVLASWSPSGITPALFFNTTEVGSGRRRIIAPFGFDRKFATDAQFLPLTENYDIPVSVAAVASARFPWLTPAAWFWGNGEAATPPAKSEIARFHIVDGGYFENSGVTTAVEIINRLQRRAQKCCTNARFYLIVLTSGDYSKGSSDAFSEAISPVVALFNSRTARTYSTVDLATRDLGVVRPGAKGVLGRISRVQRADFGEYVIPLPLGWRLSKMSATEIFFLTGRVAHCAADENFVQTSKIKGFGPVDCVQLLILHQLRGDDLGAALKQAQARHPPVPSSN